MSDVRELARLLRKDEVEARTGQAVVVSIEGATCTVYLNGGDTPVPGFRWLVDAYNPVVGDVVWYLDGGPGSKFILGVTNGRAYVDRYPPRVGGEWRRVAAQIVGSGAVGTVSWDTEDEDSHGFIVPHATNALAFTVPVGWAGRYVMFASMNSSVTIAAGVRAFIEIAASPYAKTARSGFEPTENLIAAAALYDLAVGNTFGVNMYQNSGGASNWTGDFRFWRIGP